MKKIDAKGLDCPTPVVKTKKALLDNEELVTIVDNKVAADNVKKLAVKLGCEVEVNKENEDLYHVEIKKKEDVENSKNEKEEKGKVYFFKSDELGTGEAELSDVLMKGFIHTLNEVDPLPEKIIFMNSGVKVPTKNEDAIESLIKLKNKGVTILACGTCLDYYGITDELEVGTISNMYEIVESLNNGNVVSI